MFLVSSDKFCRIKSTRILSSLQHSVSSNILFSFLNLSFYNVRFP
jgi:hypothetical protein